MGNKFDFLTRLNYINLKDTMSKFEIIGEQKLSGEIKISGAKNHALKIFPTTLLTDEDCIINNVPDIEDIKNTISLMEKLGSKITKIGNNSYKINNKNVINFELDNLLSRRLRTSILMIGPLLTRFKKAIMYHPGGCVIGKRPIDLFEDLYQELGTKIDYKNEKYHFSLIQNKFIGCKYIFKKISHTATEAILLSAVLAKGKTTVINIALEPEVTHMAELLNKMGAKIKGIGGSTIEIEGVKKLSGFNTDIIPDRIEAGSFLALAVATKSHLTITHCNPDHLDVPLKILEQIGAKFIVKNNSIEVLPIKNIKATDIKTHEYPGFPTDLQAPFLILLTQAQGMSMVHETIYEGRLFYIDIINKMGANIVLCDPHRAIVNGPNQLICKKIQSPDIRAGMALIIAALIAKGQTEIDHVELIDRGYESIEKKLINIGASIKRVG
jgi:UDP-N-acetylglucosamine 1-carboxyvinyltransferase